MGHIMSKVDDLVSSEEWHGHVTTLLPQNFDAFVWLLNLRSYYRRVRKGQGCLSLLQ